MKTVSKIETAFLLGNFVGVGVLTASKARQRFCISAYDKTAFIEMNAKHGYAVDHHILREVFAELVASGLLEAGTP